MNRAQAHAEALNEEIDAWLDRHPYELFGEYEPGPPEYYVFKVRFFEPIPATWGILLGDFAHNARSALDHLVEALIVANTGMEGSKKSQFPIVMNPCEWKRQLSRLKGVSARHISIINALQPYQRTDSQGWHSGVIAIDDPLALLNRMSNVDKHRVLNAMPATIRQIAWDVTPINDIEWFDPNRIEIPLEILIDGRELLKVPIITSGPHPEVKLDREETIEITVQHRVDLTPGLYALWTVNDPIQESMQDILSRLREIFKIFVGEFR
jgi:hypothetical protein